MAQLVTQHARLQLRRRLRTLMSVVVGLVLLQAAVLAAQRVAVHGRPEVAGEWRGG